MKILNQELHKKKYTFQELEQLINRKKKVNKLKFTNQNQSISDQRFFQIKFLKTEPSKLDRFAKRSSNILTNINFNTNSINKEHLLQQKNQANSKTMLNSINKKLQKNMQTTLNQSTNTKISQEIKLVKQKSNEINEQKKLIKNQYKSAIKFQKNNNLIRSNKKKSQNKQIVKTNIPKSIRKSKIYQINCNRISSQTSDYVDQMYLKQSEAISKKKQFQIKNEMVNIQEFFTQENDEKEKKIQVLLIESKNKDKITEFFKMLEKQIIQYTNNIDNPLIIQSIIKRKITNFMKGIYNKSKLYCQTLQKIISNTQFLQNLIIQQNQQIKEKLNIRKLRILKNKFSSDISNIDRLDVNNVIKSAKKSVQNQHSSRVSMEQKIKFTKKILNKNHSILKQIPEINFENQQNKLNKRESLSKGIRKSHEFNFTNIYKSPEHKNITKQQRRRSTNLRKQSKLTNSLNKDLHLENLKELLINQSFRLSLKRSRIKKIKSYIKENQPKICTLPENLKNYEEYLQYANQSKQQIQFNFLKQTKADNARDKQLIQDILNQVKKNEKQIITHEKIQQISNYLSSESSDFQDNYVPKFIAKVDKMSVIKNCNQKNNLQVIRPRSDSLIQKQMRNKVKFTDFIPLMIQQKNNNSMLNTRFKKYQEFFTE